MQVYIAGDHGGFALKTLLSEHLHERKFEVVDLGPQTHDPNDDYPDYAFKLVITLQQKPGDLGILICRSSGGVCIAANKVKGIKAVQATEAEMAQHARAHDNANVLCLAADFIETEEAKTIVDAFLATDFSAEERHVRRINKIEEYEETGNLPQHSH